MADSLSETTFFHRLLPRDAESRAKWRKGALAVLDYLLIQVGWFSCVGGAGKGNYWIGPLVVAVLVALHIARMEDRRRELLNILAFGAVGMIVESAQAAFGFLTFAGAPTPYLAPLWIAALWFHFGITLTPLAEALRGRLWLAGILGFVGAPFAYWAGVKLGAASFHPETWRSAVAIGVAWGGVLPVALWGVGRNLGSAGGEGAFPVEDAR